MNKIPPHNLDYEKSILSGCLLFAEEKETALELLGYEDFYPKSHKTIFRAVKYLTRKKETVDILTVKACIEAHGNLDEIGGASYLAEMIYEPIPSNTEHYCIKVKSMSSARKLIEICNTISNGCFEPGGDYGAILDKAQADVLSVDFGGKDNFITLEDLSVESMDRYEAVRDGTSAPGMRTGYHELDAVTGGGIKGSKFIVIASRPRIGKTAFMLCLARNMSRHGHKVGIFSIEMDKEELDDRLMSMETGFNTLKFTARGGLKARSDWDIVIDASIKKSEWPVWVDDTGGLSIQELKRRSRQLKKMGVEIIFIDQLSKIAGGRGRSEYEKKTDVVNQISELKKELRIPVVLLAQVNRKLEDRSNKAPALGDLKSTGSLEEDADIILLGHRPYEYDKEKEDPNLAYWEVAKNRGGPERKIQMRWEPKKTMFQDLQVDFDKKGGNEGVLCKEK